MHWMRIAPLVAASMTLACGSRARPEAFPDEAPDAASDATGVHRATTSAESDADASLAWADPPPPPSPPPRCPAAPEQAACWPSGLPCDMVHGVPCCGTCLSGMCCSGREQPCAGDGADTCCPGLRCSNRCVCE